MHYKTVSIFLLVFLGMLEGSSQTATVYPLRESNYYSQYSIGTAGDFNQGSFQLGMFANGAGTKRVVSFRKFRTDASGSSSSDRSIQIGDSLEVTLSAIRAFGKIGFALLSSPSSTSSWADRNNNIAFRMDLNGPGYGGVWGDWFFEGNGFGSTSIPGESVSYAQYRIALKHTVPGYANVYFFKDAGSPMTYQIFDFELGTANPITDMSLYLEDDWTGSNNANIIWGLGSQSNQHFLTNTGVVDIGRSNNSFSVSNPILDGLESNSSSILFQNSLLKLGSGTVTLAASNTYTGNTTISAGTLQLGASNVISNASSIILNGGTLRSTGTITETMGTLDLAESSTIDLGGTGEELTFANSSAINWNSEAELTILGWSGNAETAGIGSRIFLGSQSDLTDDQLLQIQFQDYDFGAVILPVTFELVPAIQTIKRFDNFNRGQDNAVGLPSGGNPGSWIEAEGGCGNASLVEINSDNQLQLTGGDGCSGDSNFKQASFNVTGEYSTIFEQAEGELEWYFNFRHGESNTPSGSNRTAFVLGSSEADFSSGTAVGYAVIMGDQSTIPDDAFKLIQFSTGVPTSNDFDSNEIISINNPDTDSHYSIRVSYDPCSGIWSMTVRNDGTSFRDPASISGVGTSAVNTDHVNQDLPHIGAYRRHNGNSRFSLFDNIYIPNRPAVANTYTWNPANTDYQNPNNWTPARTCTRSNDVLNFTLTANEEVTNIPNEIIGGLNVSGGHELVLRDADGGNTSRLTIRGGAFNVDAPSILVLDVNALNGTNDGIELNLIGSNTGVIDGQIIVRNSSGASNPPHRILADNPGDIQINGSVIVEDLTGNLFGNSTEENIVEFNFGSVYECSSGSNPFALTQPASRVVFEQGSTYRVLNSSVALSLGGRIYADFEYAALGTSTVTISSPADWTTDNLRILNGTLSLNPIAGDAFDVFCSGNLEIQGDLIVSPAEEIRFELNGDGNQRIFGSGNLSLSDQVVFSINNSAVGSTVELEKDLTVFNDFELLDGELQGSGSTLTMAGVDHVLRIESDLVGEVSGVADEINLVIAENTALIGNSSQCDFLNITINANKSFRLERGIRCLIGLFDVESGAELIIGTGGFVNGGTDFRRPTYQTGSTLIYRSGGVYARGLEWGTTSGAGYPDNVIIDGNTLLTPGGNTNTGTPLELSGDLSIGVNSDLFMDYFSDDMVVPLVIGGDLFLDGSISASNTSGGDIFIEGDWNQTSAVADFNPNGRQVTFNGSTQQTIDAPSELVFSLLKVENPNGLMLLDDIRIQNVFDFTDGIVVPDGDDLDGVEKVIFEAGSSVGAVSNASHYQGIVVKEGNTEFVFPIGDTSSVNSSAFLYQPVRIFGMPGTTSIEARYFGNPHPEAGPWYDGSTGANGELEEVGNCDYWEVNKTSPSDNDVRISFRYFNSSLDYCNDVGDPNTLDIASFNSILWDPVASDPLLYASEDEIASIGFINSGPPTGTYGAFTFRSSDPANNVLPITLLSFHAEVKARLVHTNWVTASELNNDFFTVERSKDGSSWEKVGTVDGAGNSNTELTYAFVDDDPYSGISYYRLRQTDFDGTTTVSEIRAVEILQGSAFGLDKVYRGQDGLNLVYRSTAPYVVVEIYDLLGKRIHGELLENYGSGFATIHPDLARGAYVLRLSHGSEMDAEKFVW